MSVTPIFEKCNFSEPVSQLRVMEPGVKTEDSGVEEVEHVSNVSTLTTLDLPPEVMYLIFSFCDVSHLLSSVQYVCNRWHELLQAVHIWKGRRLEFGRDMPCHQLMNYLRCSPNIDAISYSYSSCHQFLPCLIRHCLNLSWLKLHGDFHVPFSVLKNLKNLEYLDLNLRWRLEKKQNKGHNLTGVSSISSLKTLIVRNFNYHERFVIECVENCPNLRHICMSKVETLEMYVDPERMEDATPSSKLKTVYVYGAQNVGRDLLKLVSMPQYRCLQNLVIKPNDYSDEDFINTLFCDKFPEMITLDIGYSNLISNESMPQLVASCPNLKNLCLARCNIGDETLKLCLKKLPCLERLNLHGTLVSSELLQYFPSCFPHLTALNLLSCRLVHHYHVMHLLDAKPNIMILDRRGVLHAGGRVEKGWPFLSIRSTLM